MVGLTITKHDRGGAGEYQAHLADSDEVGRLTWVERGDVHIVDHTLVPPEIGGRGVAARLVEALVADARENGFKVKPLCSYVVAAFKRHPEWEDVAA
ncbi:GNAT family N-acetyltransferase [Novosphingobium sp. M1R2S20]|uniref:GNAT family N-acetyltransferase n=1 Tax=Novosphingobium rhizovicinum TaxID=3228928 RepID=A0ABV3R9H1_9SPHN